VFSATARLDKPGRMVAAGLPLEVLGRDHPWVSRGGIKLAHALDHFAIDPRGKVCVDIGASTGGFTDVLVSRGAGSVYAVDVGYGQLAWKLRQDPRVKLLERINARDLDRRHLPHPIDLIVCDASFIGLVKVLPAAMALTAEAAWLVALIKPQFEVERRQIGKGGVVRDPAVREAVCRRISGWLAGQASWHVLGLTESPITGPQGNVEFLIAARRSPDEGGGRAGA
jgi:23S rRNA (cytidine1920-2'-O)/16S rRNA (cytidine1409-2'-O)-methyltransferase